MTPSEAINMHYPDDLDIHDIHNWKYYTCNKRGRGAGPPERQKQYHTHYAPMNLEGWALPLFKAVQVELLPKTTQAAACTDIECANCEICSYHLGLESLYLLPPFKDMYVCNVCNRIYHDSAY
jgi:hypothetical protein